MDPTEPTAREPRTAWASADAADAYDRARPSYPAEAAAWLTGSPPMRVLELGAGTGLLTARLAELGHWVVAAEPLDTMVARLSRRLGPRPTGVNVVRGMAEQIPLHSSSVDVVVGAQAFHWFQHARALPEIARVLRPGGHIGLVWNLRDERVPWVRRLGELIGAQDTGQDNDPTETLLSSQLFGFVEATTFRFWQPLGRDGLRDLVASRSNVAMMADRERSKVLAGVDGLYDEYGRGPDGMLLPYLTHCYKAVVKPRPAPPERASTGPDPEAPPEDPGTVLFDLR